MYYVYLLFSEKDHLLYTGCTSNLKLRLKKHQTGLVKSTKYRRPLKLIYYECYMYNADARKRELYLKGGKGKSELKIQLHATLNSLEYPCL